MNKIQLDNLIKFSILFKVEGLNNTSPDYVMEKWISFIGKSVMGKSVEIDNKRLNEWYLKWRINDTKWNEVKNIAYFIYLINTVDNLDITYILKCYNKLFKEYGDVVKVAILHTNLDKKINMWLDTTRIKRDYRICLLNVRSDT